MAGDTRLVEFESILKDFRSLDASEESKLNALVLLHKILDNIIKNPNDAKYRTLKRSGAAYKSKILLNGLIGGVVVERLLLASGFMLNLSEDSVELPLDVLPESLVLFHARLTTLLHGEPQTDSPPPVSSRKKEFPPSTEESLRDLRAAQAERFKQGQNGTQGRRTESGDDDNDERSTLTRRTSTTSGQSRSAIGGFFSSLFGGGGSAADRDRARRANNRGTGPRVMTMNEIKPPPRAG